MSSEILEKIQKLSPNLKVKLSDELFLDELDQLEAQYGIKVVIILLKLLLKELPYADLENYLIKEYGFNQILAGKIKEEFGKLIVKLAGDNLQKQNLEDNSVKEKESPKTISSQNNFSNKSSESVNYQNNSISENNQPQNNQSIKGLEQQKVDNKISDNFVSPSLTFFKEDEEEIKKYQTPKIENKTNFILISRELAEKFNFSGKNQDLIKRLENIILSRFKEIRDDIELKDVLMKKNELGGLNFTETEVESLLKLIKDYLLSGKINLENQKIDYSKSGDEKNQLNKENKLSIEEEDGLPVIKMPQNIVAVNDYLPINIDDKKSISKTEEKVLPLEAKNGKINQVSDKKNFFNRFFGSKNKDIEINEKKEEYLPLKTPEINDNVNNFNDVKKSMSPIDGVSVETMPSPQPLPHLNNQKNFDKIVNQKNFNKPSLDDVKFKKQIFGPIEELENMTLIEFRRISADPKIAVNKIKEKIDLLEKQNFQKKIQGISAWQKSEVNKFYRLLGQVSMSEGKSIEEVIRIRLFAGKPTLSFDEFEAILELNKQLRF